MVSGMPACSDHAAKCASLLRWQALQDVLLWATAHGLIALHVVGRIDVDPVALHTLLEGALTDCLTRALPTTTTPGPITRSRERKHP